MTEKRKVIRDKLHSSIDFDGMTLKEVESRFMEWEELFVDTGDYFELVLVQYDDCNGEYNDLVLIGMRYENDAEYAKRMERAALIIQREKERKKSETKKKKENEYALFMKLKAKYEGEQNR